MTRPLSTSTLLAFVMPLACAAASSQAASPGYLYVAGFDLTSTGHASVNLPINAQTLVYGEHSLFEMSMSNQTGSSGNIIEIGVTTDPMLNGDYNPHWFVFSWVNGTPKGYDANSGFISSVGSFWNNPLTSYEGTSQNAAFTYTSGNWWLSLNGSSVGYFPGTIWSGAFTTSSATEVFGEVYWNGTNYPSLNGTISGYSSSGGGHLSNFLINAPYRQSDASGTGFTVSPEPASLALLALGAAALLTRRHRRH